MAFATQAALEIILQAKDEASAVFDKTSGALGGLGGIAGSVATGGLALAGAALAGIAAGAIAAAKAAFDFSQDLNQAMGRFAAQTGAAGEQLTEFRDVALDVFTAGWGESVDEVTAAMATVNQALGQTGEALETSTRQAMIIADVFEMDVAESTAIASSMMANFGISSQDAFDIITAGSQMGLNRMGDFGDTLREYSSDFERLGFNAEEMLSVLNAGLQEGAYNTDVIADGIREFGIRFSVAEEASVTALKAIGLDSDKLFAQYKAGEVTVADAMEIVTTALADVSDRTLQAQAGAALFGTKWEDIGPDVFLAAGQAREGVEGLSGATDEAGQMVTRGLGPALERLKRSTLEALLPLGDALGDLVDKAIPYIERLAEWIGELSHLFSSEAPSALGKLQSAWSTNFGWVADWVQENMPLIRDTIATVLAAIAGFWEQYGDRIVSNVQSGWEIIKAVIDTALQIILGAVKVTMQIITGDWEGAWETVCSVGEEVWENIRVIIEEALNIVMNNLSANLEMIQNLWEQAWNTVKRILEQAFKRIVRVIKDKVREVINTIKAMGQDIISILSSINLYDIGVAIVGGLIAGIKDQAGAIRDMLWKIIQDAINNIKGRLGISCPDPSPLFAELGTAMVEGIAMGITQGSNLPAMALTRQLNATIGAAQPITTNADNRSFAYSHTYVIQDIASTAMLLEAKRWGRRTALGKAI